MSLLHKLVRKGFGTPTAALQAVNAARAKKGQAATNKCTIYRHINGETHRIGDEEWPPNPPFVTFTCPAGAEVKKVAPKIPPRATQRGANHCFKRIDP